MLVLTRKSNQSIMIGDDIEVSVLSVMGDKVRIGIQAPQDIPVFRTEIYLEIHREEADGLDSASPAPPPSPSSSSPSASSPATAAHDGTPE
jgi:carbon storage regulator